MHGNRPPYRVKLIAGAYLCAVIFVLPACSKRDAIGSHQTPAEAKPGIAINLPETRALLVPLTADDFHKIDVMALGGCGLQITLGKYQSSLGRWASDSQRLLLELEYLRLAPQCIYHKHTLGQAELAALLKEIQGVKREQLPRTIYNATLANTEFQQLWRNSAITEKYPVKQRLAIEAILAVNTLTGRWLAGDYRAINIDFEIHLSEIAQGSISHHASYSQELHHQVVQLEQYLAVALPTRYSIWIERRRHNFVRLEQSMKLD